jgi:uncharacterized protein YndB with AHSA1/START domain
VASAEFTVTIDAKPEGVWPWVADLARDVEWSPKPYRVEWIQGGPNAVGSRFRSVGVIPGDKDHANEGEITESQPYARFALLSKDDQGEYANTYTLVPSGVGTEVRYRLEFLKMHGIAALLLPVEFPLWGRPQARKRMEALKAKVESSA